jgi:hypothetical protein
MEFLYARGMARIFSLFTVGHKRYFVMTSRPRRSENSRYIGAGTLKAASRSVELGRRPLGLPEQPSCLDARRKGHEKVTKRRFNKDSGS